PRPDRGASRLARRRSGRHGPRLGRPRTASRAALPGYLVAPAHDAPARAVSRAGAAQRRPAELASPGAAGARADARDFARLPAGLPDRGRRAAVARPDRGGSRPGRQPGLETPCRTPSRLIVLPSTLAENR